jgi:DNA-directed RNA polymerase specialized sigma24 family protein
VIVWLRILIARIVRSRTNETETPARYCYIVARFVFMEHLRAVKKENLRDAEIRSQLRPGGHPRSDEKMIACLERCAGKLEPLNREVISRYYVGKGHSKNENRRALAEELGISINALSVRACRIRDRLEACVKECIGMGV